MKPGDSHLNSGKRREATSRDRTHTSRESRSSRLSRAVFGLPAGFAIEVRALCLPGFNFPGLQQGRLTVFSHLDDEIHEA
jgi:hypothetical protein